MMFPGSLRGVRWSLLMVLLALAGTAQSADATQGKTTKLDFNRDIRPILSDHLFLPRAG